jgi:SAM-dependent methyltransferase
VHPLFRNWALALLDPLQPLGLARLPRYFAQLVTYRASERHLAVRLRDTYPCLADSGRQTPFDPHYFYQGAWLARELAAAKPSRHVDVGSSVLMVSTVSALVPTVFVDYRPLQVELPGLECVAGDACRLPFSDRSVPSLSCLHVVEHIGLGRYGDPIDPEGSAKAARELARVLAPGGRLYLSAPVGRARVCFNAHRVFDPQALPQMFPGLRRTSFSFVDDAGAFHRGGDPAAAAGSEYACGMYVLVKAA